MRLIAKSNIRGADDRCASRWFEFLGELYVESEDKQICLDMMVDSRPDVQGNALALLCEHHPETPGLYEKAIGYVQANQPPSTIFRYEYCERIINHLYGVIRKKQPKEAEAVLREWLSEGSKPFRRRALSIIQEEKLYDLQPDVIECLNGQKSLREKYHCIKTLCHLTGKPIPSITLVEEDPNAYISQFQE